VELARVEGLPLTTALGQMFGAAPRLVSAYLLGLWGLPQGVIEELAQGESRVSNVEVPAGAEAVGVFHAGRR